MTRRKIEYWVIPPEADGEFVANMEEVLETYEKSYDPQCPVLCMDEQPVQLIGETRVPIKATKNHPERVDYEYERKGTASIFMFAEPLSGFRQATARPRRTKVDWALEVAALLDTRYAKCPKVGLVCDNLNTHTKGAFYEAFPPDQARDYVRRIDFVYTPKWTVPCHILRGLSEAGQRRFRPNAFCHVGRWPKQARNANSVRGLAPQW